MGVLSRVSGYTCEKAAAYGTFGGCFGHLLLQDWSCSLHLGLNVVLERKLDMILKSHKP